MEKTGTFVKFAADSLLSERCARRLQIGQNVLHVENPCMFTKEKITVCDFDVPDIHYVERIA